MKKKIAGCSARLSPEAELLLFVLRARWDPSGLDQVVFFNSSTHVNWQAFASLAVAHGVGPLAYKIAQSMQGVVPDSAMQALQDQYYRAALANTLWFHELEAIAGAFDNLGIPLLVLKGAAFARTLYSDPGLRPMTDLDLWINARNLDQALLTLRDLGFETQDLDPRPGFTAQHGPQLSLQKSGAYGTLAELHWEPPFPTGYESILPSSWLWQHSRPFPIGESHALCLHPAAALLHQAVHISHHGAALRWIWLCDLRELVESDRMDLPELLDSARSLRAVLPLQYALRACQELLPSPRLAGLLARLQQARPPRREKLLFQLGLAAPQSVPAAYLLALVRIPGWRARGRFLQAILFPSPEFLRERYGRTAASRSPFPLYLHRFAVGARHLARLVLTR